MKAVVAVVLAAAVAAASAGCLPGLVEYEAPSGRDTGFVIGPGSFQANVNVNNSWEPPGDAHQPAYVPPSSYYSDAESSYD